MQIDIAAGASGFEALYAGHRDRLRRLAYLLTGRREVAEDLVQEAFLRLHRHWDDVEAPAGYVRTVLSRLCADWRRRSARATADERWLASGPPAADAEVAARAEVMAPGDGAAWDPDDRGAPAALAPAALAPAALAPVARRAPRRALVAAVAAAVVASAGVAGAVALGGGGGEARVGPAGDPGGCQAPKPAVGKPAAGAPQATAPGGCPPGAPATKPPDGGADHHGRPASFLIPLAYVRAGHAADQDAWIDLVWFSSPQASTGTGGEPPTVDGHPARYRAVAKGPGVIAVSVDYGDGLAELEAVGATRDQILAMAATLHRTGPATFTATPPAGWVPAPTTP